MTIRIEGKKFFYVDTEPQKNFRHVNILKSKPVVNEHYKTYESKVHYLLEINEADIYDKFLTHPDKWAGYHTTDSYFIPYVAVLLNTLSLEPDEVAVLHRERSVRIDKTGKSVIQILFVLRDDFVETTSRYEGKTKITQKTKDKMAVASIFKNMLLPMLNAQLQDAGIKVEFKDDKEIFFKCTNWRNFNKMVHEAFMTKLTPVLDKMQLIAKDVNPDSASYQTKYAKLDMEKALEVLLQKGE